ncbi:basic proline-rich protein-like [Choloepus didactylus]|uniref:basic proline-rich protein-like n=1 Tax=Choloepus didactylus TaxID=27675 RepID=UPI00189EC7C0|nr:basic proline-rich protein-like [Choloepus didactylus]
MAPLWFQQKFWAGFLRCCLSGSLRKPAQAGSPRACGGRTPRLRDCHPPTWQALGRGLVLPLQARAGGRPAPTASSLERESPAAPAQARGEEADGTHRARPTQASSATPGPGDRRCWPLGRPGEEEGGSRYLHPLLEPTPPPGAAGGPPCHAPSPNLHPCWILPPAWALHTQHSLEFRAAQNRDPSSRLHPRSTGAQRQPLKNHKECTGGLSKAAWQPARGGPKRLSGPRAADWSPATPAGLRPLPAGPVWAGVGAVPFAPGLQAAPSRAGPVELAVPPGHTGNSRSHETPTLCHHSPSTLTAPPTPRGKEAPRQAGCLYTPSLSLLGQPPSLDGALSTGQASSGGASREPRFTPAREARRQQPGRRDKQALKDAKLGAAQGERGSGVGSHPTAPDTSGHPGGRGLNPLTREATARQWGKAAPGGKGGLRPRLSRPLRAAVAIRRRHSPEPRGYRSLTPVCISAKRRLVSRLGWDRPREGKCEAGANPRALRGPRGVGVGAAKPPPLPRPARFPGQRCPRRSYEGGPWARAAQPEDTIPPARRALPGPGSARGPPALGPAAAGTPAAGAAPRRAPAPPPQAGPAPTHRPRPIPRPTRKTRLPGPAPSRRTRPHGPAPTLRIRLPAPSPSPPAGPAHVAPPHPRDPPSWARPRPQDPLAWPRPRPQDPPPWARPAPPRPHLRTRLPPAGPPHVAPPPPGPAPGPGPPPTPLGAQALCGGRGPQGSQVGVGSAPRTAGAQQMQVSGRTTSGQFLRRPRAVTPPPRDHGGLPGGGAVRPLPRQPEPAGGGGVGPSSALHPGTGARGADPGPAAAVAPGPLQEGLRSLLGPCPLLRRRLMERGRVPGDPAPGVWLQGRGSGRPGPEKGASISPPGGTP